MERENPRTYISGVRNFLTIFFKYKRMILTVFLVVAIIGITVALQIPAMYEAKANLLVKFGREFMYRPEVGERAASITAMNREEAMNNEIKILTNQDLMKKVVGVLGVENLYPKLINKKFPQGITAMDFAVRDFEKNFSATISRGSSVIEVSFRHENPAMAAKAVNTLIEFFTDKHVEVYSDPKSSFLEEQASEYDTKLKEAEGNLQAFKQKHQVFSLEEQRNTLLRQRSELDTTLKTTETQIRELQTRIAFVKSPQWRTEISPEARGQLAILEQKEQELLERYAENSRFVQSVRKEIQVRKDTIQRGTEDSRQVELSKLEGELGPLQVKADGLRRQLGQVAGQIPVLDGREKEFVSLKRELATREANYKTYVDKSEEARISDDLNKRKMTNVSILQAATAPTDPAKRDRAKFMLMALVLGLVGGIGLAFVLETVPQRCTTPLSAEKHLSLPVIVYDRPKKVMGNRQWAIGNRKPKQNVGKIFGD